jgi:hypothetical protein
VAFVIVGIVSAILPFGPSVSNPDVIPQADPQAGLGLIQALGLDTARYMGLGLALLGVVMLLCSGVIARYDAKHGGNGNA